MLVGLGDDMRLESFFIYVFAPATAIVSTGFVLYSLISIMFDGRIAWFEPDPLILFSEILLCALGFFFLMIVLFEHVNSVKRKGI